MNEESIEVCIHKNSRQEKIRQFHHLLSLAKIFCVKDCIVNMATLAKIFSMNFFCNAKVAGLGEILSSKNFHIYIWYSQGLIEPRSSKRTCIKRILLLK